MALLQERLIVLEEQVVSAPGQPWHSACLVALEAERQRYQANNVQKTLDLVTTQQRDVVILDVSPPDRDGLEVLTCLKQTHPVSLDVQRASWIPVCRARYAERGGRIPRLVE